MVISLQKGGNISLTKEVPGLSKIMVGLGWDARTTTGTDFDLDASALLIGAGGKVRSDADFIFYGQTQDAAGSVAHQGDNRTGEGEGDDEQILVDLDLIPADVEKVVVIASIHEADSRGQNFGQVRNAYIRLLNNDTGAEEVHFDLSEDSSSETAVVFAELYRKQGGWSFKAIDQGYATGLAGVARDFGVNVG